MLVAAQYPDLIVLIRDEKADMAAVFGRAVPAEYDDVTFDRGGRDIAAAMLIVPRPGRLAVGGLQAGLFDTVIDEGGAPRRLVVGRAALRGAVIHDDPWIVFVARDFGNAQAQFL